MRRRWRWFALVAGAAVLMVAILLSGDGDQPRRVPLTPTSARPDLSGVALPGVEGTTTSTQVENIGEVSFTGVVKAPNGATVPEATVRAEWFRVDPPEVIEVITDEEGRFEITGVAPGRWRIRAWRTPDFATGAVEAIFVEEEEEREIELAVESVEELAVTWDIETDPPITDHNAELVVSLVEQTVDVEGRTSRNPAADLEVELLLDDDWQRVRGGEVETTDDDGRVTWLLRCRDDGKQTVRVRTEFGTETLDVAACIPITATTTTTTEPQETTTTT